MTTENEKLQQALRAALNSPADAHVGASRQRVRAWFTETAPLIAWDMTETPIGPLYAAATAQGLCQVAFRLTEAEFVARLDPLAHAVHDPQRLSTIMSQIRAYFADPATDFALPIDLRAVTPFQRSALQLIRQIPPGSVWTYKQVAERLGRPTASRAIGQAMARNPVPIVIPCHRVVGSGGSLRGYGGGGGVATKEKLLKLEGAL